jgi:hypothetical protein
MGRRVHGRLVSRLLAGGGLALVGAATIFAGPTTALADGELTQITITGVDIDDELVVRAEDRPELCTSLHREVNWLVGRKGDAREPEDPETLGAEYALVVYLDDEPAHRFHLYPLAEGGPKAFRPAEQPGDRTVREAWFHARLSLHETLGAAGVPLTGEPVPPGGGTGGGGAEPAPEETEEPLRPALAFLDEWRQSMLLTAAVVVGIVVGLGGIAFLIRRRV